MTSHLGTYICRQRERQGLSRGDVARAMGRKNVSKACRRLLDLETGQGCPQDFWNALRAVLDIDEAEVASAVQLDREAYERWLDEPVPMQLIIKWIPCVYGKVELPPEALEDPVRAEAFACQTARKWERKVCLVISRREQVRVNERGQVTGRSGEDTSVPYMQVGGKRFLFRTHLET